jgi:hypothetical protein
MTSPSRSVVTYLNRPRPYGASVGAKVDSSKAPIYFALAVRTDALFRQPSSFDQIGPGVGLGEELRLSGDVVGTGLSYDTSTCTWLHSHRSQ